MGLIQKFSGLPTATGNLVAVCEAVMTNLQAGPFQYKVPRLESSAYSDQISELPFTLLTWNNRPRNDQYYLKTAELDRVEDLLLKNIYENQHFNPLVKQKDHLRKLAFTQIGGETYLHLFLGKRLQRLSSRTMH